LIFITISDSEGRKVSINEARTIPLRDVKSKDKYDQATNYFIGDSQDGSRGKSSELRKKIDKYKKAMVELSWLKKSNKYGVTNIGLDTKGPYFDAEGKQQKNWEMHNFYHTILAADITILNKLLAEINNAELEVVSFLFNRVTGDDYSFDKVQAEVIPRSNYVLTGQKYDARIFVAALDTKSEISGEINMNGTIQKIDGESGMLHFVTDVGSSTGVKNFSGSINVKKKGRTENYKFNSSYLVAEPSVNVSAEKMNVFYIGVDNPVVVSVPGVADDLVHASITNGTITKRSGRGKYMVRVPNGSTLTHVKVSAKFDEESRTMGSAEFRVKRVPDPIATVAGKSKGGVLKAQVIAAGGIIPSMPPGFDFHLHFRIKSFVFSAMINGDFVEEACTGNQFNNKVKRYINMVRRGHKVYFENIIAKGPDGSNRKLNPVILKLL